MEFCDSRASYWTVMCLKVSLKVDEYKVDENERRAGALARYFRRLFFFLIPFRVEFFLANNERRPRLSPLAGFVPVSEARINIALRASNGKPEEFMFRGN